MIGLNQLRTAYVQAPPSVRRFLSPILSAIPVRYRFGGTYVTYRKNIERSHQDLDFVVAWRRNRLRIIVEAATTKAPHYRRIAKSIGFDLATISTLDIPDLAQFPILTKEELRGHVEEFLTCPAEKLDHVSTSGSSGTPLSFYLDKDRSSKEWAFVQDSWSRIGFKPKNIRAVFRGVHLDNVDKKPWEFEPALGELRLSPFHLTDRWMEEYCNLMLRYRATFLHGYPSAISIFSNYVLRSGRRDITDLILGIIGSSEPLLSHQRDLMMKAFPHARVLSFYGLSEKNIFGSEGTAGPEIFEMDPLYGIAELVDEHGNVIKTPGERGRIIGTGLLFQGMPFIRYETGDLAELVESACPKNFFRMKIKGIVPRRGQEFLVGSSGELISMTAINIHSPAYSKVSSFQFHQEIPGKVTLKAIAAPGCTTEDISPFINEISAKIGTSLAFNIEIVDKLSQNTRGKAKFIEQKIDISKYR